MIYLLYSPGKHIRQKNLTTAITMFHKSLFLIIIAIIIVVLPQCTRHKSSAKKHHDTITIWVHGTRLTPPMISPRFFYHKPGFTPAYKIDHSYQWHTIAQTLIDADPKRFSWPYFYFFGWSGKLNPAERFKASQELYDHIINIIQAHRKRHKKTPKIRIITHSHGGNVALNLAHVNHDASFSVDELIMLACPVQQQTAHLIQHDIFKKIYSLYSRFDSFQIIDMQGFHKDEDGKRFRRPFLSARTFDLHPNLFQVQLSWNKRGIMHVEFITAKFLRHIPWLIDSIDEWYNNVPDAEPKAPWACTLDR